MGTVTRRRDQMERNSPRTAKSGYRYPVAWCFVAILVVFDGAGRAQESAPVATAPPTSPSAPVASAVFLDLADAGTPRLVEEETRFLSFSDAESQRGLLEGWHEPRGPLQYFQAPTEERFKRLLGAGSILAQIELTVLTPRDRVLAVKMRQHSARGLGPQKVDLVWNSTGLGTCVFEDADAWTLRDFEFAVPKDAQRSGANVVTFLSRFAVSPQQLEREDAQGRPHAFTIACLEVQDTAARSRVEADPPVEMANGAIVQSPNTRLRFPLKLAPQAGLWQLAIDAVEGAGATDRIGLRWDSIQGVQEEELWHAGSAVAGMISADLGRFDGQMIEVVFDTSGRTDGEPVTWRAPRIAVQDLDADPLGNTTPTASPPTFQNVLVIVLDALRAHNVGCYGYIRDTTPNIDALAQEGVLFDRAYASAPYTTSSTWSLFTSLHPFQHGGVAGVRQPVPSVPTLQKVLHDQGLVTGCVSANPFVGKDSPTRLARDFDEVIEAFDDVAGMVRLEPRDSTKVTNAAIDFLERRRAERFFLYVHYMLPHEPYYPAPEFVNFFSLDPVKSAEPHAAWIEAVNRRAKAMRREQCVQLQTRYDEGIRNADTEMQHILDVLGQLGLAEQTLVILTADHGDSFWEHGTLSHGRAIYDDTVKVPLVLRAPGLRDVLPARYPHIVNTVDLFPTICQLLGVEKPAYLAGRSVVGRPADPDPDEIQAFCQGDFLLMQAHWWPRYKLIRHYTCPHDEVYDLALDPGETRDIADQFPVLRDYLLAKALAWKAENDAFQADTLEVNKEAIGAEQIERLRALGYLNE